MKHFLQKEIVWLLEWLKEEEFLAFAAIVDFT
jgi:hypothetical protein